MRLAQTIRMDAREKGWAEEADRLVGASSFSFAGAARLVATIAQNSRDRALVDAAKQVLPSLKAAAIDRSDSFRDAMAQRRFLRLREALHARARPAFGRRAGGPFSPSPLRVAKQGESERLLLGLPGSGEITVEAVRAAFKRAAKAAHPDHGGSTEAFAALVAARDALLEGG